MIRTINSAVCDRCKANIREDYVNQHINQIEVSELPFEMIFRATLPQGRVSHLCGDCLHDFKEFMKNV